jgi:type VI secretion system protein ImpF
MHGFSPGLFDRLDGDDTQSPPTGHRARARAFDECRRSITRDLESLLNTRSALLPADVAPYPAVSGSIVNYGLIDFAGMCMTSDTDQQQICTAVRRAIQRHEPRLQKVAVTLRPKKGAINRVEFMITAQLKSAAHTESPLSFNAVFRPSLQQYSIDGAT